jgi:hypothetical protein
MLGQPLDVLTWQESLLNVVGIRTRASDCLYTGLEEAAKH